MWKQWLNWTIKFLTNQRGNLVKMFSPPKSKSPWEAMTRGSSPGNSWIGKVLDIGTGGALGGLNIGGGKGSGLFAGSDEGWANKYAPGERHGWVGPVGTAAASFVPFVGPALSAGAGAMGTMGGKGSWLGNSGFQGTDKGWGNVLPTIMGGIAGYGAGSAAKNLLGGGSGANAIPSAGGNIMQPTYGGAPAMSGTASGGASMLGTAGTGIAGAAGGVAGAAGGAGNAFNLSNMAMKTLGAGMLGGSAMMQPPSISTRPDMARQATEMPNLVEAQGMMRDLAMMNPSELVGPAGDQYIEASLRQTRQAHQYQRQQTINDFASQGKTIGKSGSANERLARMDEAQAQRESDFITQTNEARYIAGINTKIQTVSNYLQMSQEQAADLLASYGYISPEDLLNYQSALASYQGTQQALGQAGGQLLGGMYSKTGIGFGGI